MITFRYKSGAAFWGTLFAATVGLCGSNKPFFTYTGSAEAPDGYTQMCKESPQYCTLEHPPTPSPVSTLSVNDQMKLLKKVNVEVNSRVHQQSDLQTYGVEEKWTPSGENWPRAKGDCEDIAIEKRILLLKRGFPPDKLAYAVVYAHGVGLHAVLVAHLESGDFILDSRTPWIEPWGKTSAEYSYLSVQDWTNSSKWQSVQSPNAVTNAAPRSTAPRTGATGQ